MDEKCNLLRTHIFLHIFSKVFSPPVLLEQHPRLLLESLVGVPEVLVAPLLAQPALGGQGGPRGGGHALQVQRRQLLPSPRASDDVILPHRRPLESSLAFHQLLIRGQYLAKNFSEKWAFLA